MPRTALVTGIGLMGGSLAAALAGAGWRVLLHHRRPEVAAQAERAGFGVAVADPVQAVAAADVAIVCTPVSTIAGVVRQLAAGPGRAVITDVGSTKHRLCAELADLAAAGRYVGSHPMAGSHRQGLEHADAALFHGRSCVVTPTPDTPAPATLAVEELWRAVGGRVVRLDPAAHDRAVAEASHLPHVLAATAAAGLSDLGAPLAASGFRDTTRVAGGSPELWRDILLDNREAVLAGVDASLARLASLRAALAAGDAEAVRAWLQQGGDGRSRFENQPLG